MSALTWLLEMEWIQVHPSKSLAVGRAELLWKMDAPSTNKHLCLGWNLHVDQLIMAGAVRNTEISPGWLSRKVDPLWSPFSSLIEKWFPADTPHLDVILKDCSGTLVKCGSATRRNGRKMDPRTNCDKGRPIDRKPLISHRVLEETPKLRPRDLFPDQMCSKTTGQSGGQDLWSMMVWSLK